jgi:EpsI family protein
MMTASRVRAVIAMVLMVAGCVGAYAWRPTTLLVDARQRIELETLFPKSFGGWRIDERMPVQLVSPDQAELLRKIYDQTLSRSYIGPGGERVMLSVAYGGDQSDATRAHRPEVCYPAQGFQVTSNQTAPYSAAGGRVVMARELTARLGGRIEPITYWIVVGDEVATTGTRQKLVQMRFGMKGIVPDGMLVRVSTIDPDSKRAAAVHAAFVTALSQAIPEGTRSRVFGDLRR